MATGGNERNDRTVFDTRGRKLIDRAAESKRERFPTFGEELALLNFCGIEGPRGNTHLRPLLIVAAHTGLRRNELLTLADTDLDFNREFIRARPACRPTGRGKSR